jgi:hypothetical protein
MMTTLSATGKIAVQELRLVGTGLDVLFHVGSLEIPLRDIAVIHPFPEFAVWPLAFVRAVIRKTQDRIPA